MSLCGTTIESIIITYTEHLQLKFLYEDIWNIESCQISIIQRPRSSYVDSSNINQIYFLKCRDSHVKQNHYTDSQRQNTCNCYNISLFAYLLFYVVITMSEQVVLLAVAQCITVNISNQWKCETCWDCDENQSTVWWWNPLSQGPRCVTGVSHLKKAKHRLKICKDYTFCRDTYGQHILEFSRHLT